MDKPLNNFGLMETRPKPLYKEEPQELNLEDIGDSHPELALKLESTSQEIDYE